MGTAPWGPHGPQVPAHTVTPNPTAPSGPVPQFGQESYSFPQGNYQGSAYAGGGGLRLIVGNFLFSLLMITSLWELFVCLYPLTVATGVLASFAVTPLVAHADPSDLEFARAMGIISIVVVAYIMIRVEYRLAQIRGYRVVRHALRLPLLGIVAIPVLMMIQSAQVPGSAHMFILMMLASPARLMRFVANPVNAGILLAFVAAAHFVLWYWRRPREFWHGRLRAIGMK